MSFLAALGRHPYARFTLGMARESTGVVLGETVVWWGETAFGRIGHAFGPPVALPRLGTPGGMGLPLDHRDAAALGAQSVQSGR